MKFKKLFLITCFVICLFTIASVCASEVDDTAITAIDSEDNLEINEDNQVMDKTDSSIGVDDSLNEPQEDNAEISAPGTSDNNKLGIADDDLVGADLMADVTAFNISVVDNTIFVVDCSDDFNGNVSIKVNEDVLYNASVKTIIKASNLPAGNYVATAVFYGGGNYGDVTLNNISFTVSRVTPTIEVDIDDVTYPNSAHAVVNIGNNANGTVNVTVGKRTFNGTVYNGYANVSLFGLSAGYKEAKVEFFSRDHYNNDVIAHTKFIVYPNNSNVEIVNCPSTFKVGEDIEFTIKTHNSTGDLKIYINGEYYGKSSYPENRNCPIAISDKSEGAYTIELRLDNDENYTASANSITVYVVKNDISLYVQGISEVIRVGSPVTFTAKLNSTVTGNVIFTINGANYTEYVDNTDTVTHIYTPSNNDTLTVVATFMGNNMYNAKSANSVDFDVARISTEVYVDVVSPIKAGDDGQIYVTLAPGINAIVELNVSDKFYDVAVVDGQGWYIVSNLADAVYNVQVVFEGDDKYEGSTSDVKQLVVNKVLTNLNISIDKPSMNYIEQAVVSIDLNQSMNAAVTLKVNGRNYTVGLVNGKGSFTLYDLDKGNYIINAVFAGDDNYVGCTSNALNLTVNGDNISSSLSIDLESRSVFVGDEVIIGVNSDYSVTGIIKLNIGSYSYNVVVKRGIGILGISDLPNGTYDVQAVFDGDNMHLGNSSNVERLEVKRIPTNLSVSVDKSSVFVGDSVFVGVVLNYAINNVVTISVNGKDYLIGIVDGKGNLTLSDLAFGTYTVNATFAGEDKYRESYSNNVAFEVNKFKTQLTADPIAVEYNVNRNLIITLKDSNGNPVGGVGLIVNLNGAKTFITDNNGQIRVSTNGLAPKEYSAKITFNGNAVYDTSAKDVKVTVRKATPILGADKKTFKVKTKTKKYSVTLKDSAGKAIEKAEITLKVKGKTYKVKTNSKGVSTFKIGNLNKKGKYTATVRYGGDKYYNSKSVKVKITVR